MSALAVKGLTLAHGTRGIVSDFSMQAAAGEVVALMGPSGTGKTTILRAIAGLHPFPAGSIEVSGHVGMVFQFHALFANLSALDNVTLAPVHVRRMPRPAAEARARELLESLGVGARAHAMPHQLSGGEAQRVAIARALAMDPAVLLMDEPTASLDESRRADLAGLLRGLARSGRTIVVATHDRHFAEACADRIVQM